MADGRHLRTPVRSKLQTTDNERGRFKDPWERRSVMLDTTTLDQALQKAITKLCADNGTIHIKDADELILHLVASHDVPQNVLDVVREVPWGKGMAGLAAQLAEPVDYCKLQNSTPPQIHPKARATRTRGARVRPMMNGAEVVGTIGIGCRSERSFSAQEIRWLRSEERRVGKECRSRWSPYH